MNESSEQDLILKAKEFCNLKISWHFHLLTPNCVFNKKGGFVLILENSDNNEQYFNHSEAKQEETSKKLLELLHGIKADEKSDITSPGEISEAVQKMASRARELTEKGISWHHHVFFPVCVFNDQKGKWKVMLEDRETNEILESITVGKPEEDLKIIEPLFYHQKRGN